MQKILVKTDGACTTVYIDGVCLENVTSVSFAHAAVDEVAELSITLLATKLIIDGEAVVTTVEEVIENEQDK